MSPEQEERSNDIATRLLAIMEAQHPDGSPRYSAQELRHFVPILLLTSTHPLDPAALPPSLREVLIELAEKASLASAKTDGDIQAAIATYYERHPINPQLLLAFKQFIRGEAQHSDIGERIGAAFAKLCGTDSPLARFSRRTRESEGISGGPLARWALNNDDVKH